MEIEKIIDKYTGLNFSVELIRNKHGWAVVQNYGATRITEQIANEKKAIEHFNNLKQQAQ